MIESSDMYCTQPSILSHLLLLLSLKQWQASDQDEEEEENTSVYIDTSGSGGRGWVIHLLHLLVEEGAKVGNVSTNSPTISEGGGGMNLNISLGVPYVTDKVSRT